MNESPIFQDDKNDNEVEVPPVVDVNIDEDDLGVSEVNLDDDDDIFKSARLEPEPMKVEPAETFSSRPVETSGGLTNGHATADTGLGEAEPAETDIPLEDDDDDRPFDNAHLKPGLQLQSEPATISAQQTLTSFHEVRHYFVLCVHSNGYMRNIAQEEARKELETGDEFIEIEVTSPHKVGEGMSSFMAYTVKTKTNLSYFKKNNPEVNRRFSDFLGLRDKLCEKYLQNGRIIPPCPDKSVIGMTKVKMSKEDEASNQSGELLECQINTNRFDCF